MKAIWYGGPNDGQEVFVPDTAREIIIPDPQDIKEVREDTPIEPESIFRTYTCPLELMSYEAGFWRVFIRWDKRRLNS